MVVVQSWSFRGLEPLAMPGEAGQVPEAGRTPVPDDWWHERQSCHMKMMFSGPESDQAGFQATQFWKMSQGRPGQLDLSSLWCVILQSGELLPRTSRTGGAQGPMGCRGH